MKPLSERKKALLKNEVSESNHIPYMRHITDDVVKTYNGDFIVTFKIDGLAHETKSDDELDAASKMRKELFNKFSGKPVQLYTHVVRRKVEINSKSQFSEKFLINLNEKYSSKFKGKNYFINELYLTVVRKGSKGFLSKQNPLLKIINKLINKKPETEKKSKSNAEIIDEINEYKTVILGSLSKYKAKTLKIIKENNILWSEPMTFWGYLINNQFVKYKLPDGPINKYLPINRKYFGWKNIAIKKNKSETHAVLLSIKNYCNSTFAGMIDNVSGINSECVLTQSWEPLSRSNGVEKVQLIARRMSQGDSAVTLQNDLQKTGGIIDTLSSGEESLGVNHFSLFLFDENKKRLDDNVGEAQRELAAVGINAETDSLNLECAWWAQLPGNKSYIARKGDITAFNFADMSSFHNVPLGEDECKWGEYITILKTTSGSPYKFNWHYGDTGIVSVIGPSGSGKTVAMSFGIAQTLKHNPKVFFFDKDQGAKIFINAINGDYSSLKSGEPTGWNPLYCDNTPSNRGFLSTFWQMILEGNQPLSPAEKNKINELINYIFELKPDDRRLNKFAPMIISSMSSRYENYRRWIAEESTGIVGELAWVFDNDQNKSIANKNIVGFDMDEFIDNDEIRGPIFNYLFHQIFESLDGSPVVITIDEGWKALDHPVFEEQIENWARTIRKMNGILIIGTQNPGDASKNKALVQQSKTEIFFPSPKGRYEDYKEWNLSDREIKLLREIIDPQSRFFLIRKPSGSALAKLELSGCEDEIAVLSGRKETVALMDKLMAEHGKNADQWLPEFKKRWRHA